MKFRWISFLSHVTKRFDLETSIKLKQIKKGENPNKDFGGWVAGQLIRDLKAGKKVGF